MSTLEVKYAEIAAVEKHFNADRLEVVKLKGLGWEVVTSKLEDGSSRFKVGDTCIYVPIDSVIPPKLEAILFPEGSKIKPKKGRIETTKIRGVYSQGMIIEVDKEIILAYPELLSTSSKSKEDLKGILGIVKYEPPAPAFYKGMKTEDTVTDGFNRYTDIENIKNFPNLLQEGEMVHISEKLHGTSARIICMEKQPKGILDKIRKVFRIDLGTIFIVGSRNKELRLDNSNLYSNMFRKMGIEKLLRRGETLYGEIVGPSIQANYTYGFKEHQFFAYDLQINGKYVDPFLFEVICRERGIPTCPRLTEEVLVPYSPEIVAALKVGKGFNGQAVREGIVVKSMSQRRVLKAINEDYLMLKGNSDFH